MFMYILIIDGLVLCLAVRAFTEHAAYCTHATAHGSYDAVCSAERYRLFRPYYRLTRQAVLREVVHGAASKDQACERCDQFEPSKADSTYCLQRSLAEGLKRWA